MVFGGGEKAVDFFNCAIDDDTLFDGGHRFMLLLSDLFIV
jgi:hypothetical protein